MKAMILAAGLGTRMRPLTDHCPKPLLKAGGKPLIVHHIERLRDAGITELVINVSHLADSIITTLGDGSAYGVSIAWSREQTPLETAGGIRKAISLLGAAPFVLVNGDVWSDFDVKTLAPLGNDLARLVLVDNPAHHPNGDFHLDRQGRVHVTGQPQLTYAGIGLYDPALVVSLTPGHPVKLAPLLKDAMNDGYVGGLHHRGQWFDIGTPERLTALQSHLSQA
ncbi:N-acetylmuramate alpha-1-phosphate uridylyltransferase MurU [Phytohalomonas tamaricis]|uniref:N-acetylmuramate alpha-1-phosphate uridylyltransferase MurU n=1 Tax=Phytohalomonas tamaricis TaxID=2081032 RepID=UPI000D0B5519|nr:nucleotidyltransferase family protein [Phytohalomonas tamaricis]